MVDKIFKDLNTITASSEILRYKAFNIAKNLKYDGYYFYNDGITLIAYKCFDKQTSPVPV